ncbi:MAG: transposase, partial [Clostridia bacterium]|nr:transposase [Clostridia bacterium]
RSFAEAKENHGLRFARMLGIQNMREQCFLTAAVQNMKRLVKAFYSITPSVCMLKAHVLNLKTWALLMV